MGATPVASTRRLPRRIASTHAALTRQLVHQAHQDPENIGLDDNLMDWGLDSMRLLDLVVGWNAEGLALDVMEIGAETTLNGWWRVVQQHQAH